MSEVQSVQWFPGHMAKTRRKITEDLKLVDIAAELLDARVPKSSANPVLRQIVRQKPRVVLLNKSDMADPAQTARWVDWYKAQGADLLGYAEDNYEMSVSDYEVSKASGYSFTPTTEEMTYEVTYADEAVYSVRRTWTVSGAMPYSSTFRLSEQFDAVTGAKLGFADLFSDADGVGERVVAAFLAQEEIAAGGFTEAQITAAYQPEHFYLTEEGFVFWIQGNDLPALHSPVEVTLSFDSLADLRHG